MHASRSSDTSGRRTSSARGNGMRSNPQVSTRFQYVLARFNVF
nr:MAG TPA: hypothetical protein [Caudoviricetes sp.]